MKTAILLVTGNSLSLAETLHQEMNDSEIFTLEHFPGCTYISSLSDFIEENFDEYDAFIFICAMGICVRTIAPHVKDKHTDPAVICMMRYKCNRENVRPYCPVTSGKPIKSPKMSPTS